jgi:hypothetical protein
MSSLGLGFGGSGMAAAARARAADMAFNLGEDVVAAVAGASAGSEMLPPKDVDM